MKLVPYKTSLDNLLKEPTLEMFNGDLWSVPKEWFNKIIIVSMRREGPFCDGRYVEFCWEDYCGQYYPAIRNHQFLGGNLSNCFALIE